MQKKDIVEISITSTLVFVLLFAVINVVEKTKQSKRSQTKDNEVSEEKVAQEKTPPQELFRIQEEEGKNLELRKDPFTTAPIAPIGTSYSGIQLNGILWDKVGAIAIINDNIVKVGDKIGENIVVEIEQDRVILNDGNRDFELRLER